ncbi:MAG: hypothetical protein AAGG81_08180, partial [Chlamydiota bacterium]
TKNIYTELTFLKTTFFLEYSGYQQNKQHIIGEYFKMTVSYSTYSNSFATTMQKLVASCRACNPEGTRLVHIFYQGKKVSLSISHCSDVKCEESKLFDELLPQSNFYDCPDGKKRYHIINLTLSFLDPESYDQGELSKIVDDLRTNNINCYATLDRLGLN